MQSLIYFVFFVTVVVNTEANYGIFGGSDVSTMPDSCYNSFVSILDIDLNRICSGTIIGSKWILTAAHCVNNTGARFVSYGTTKNDINTGGKHRIQEITIHKEYSRDRKHNTALLKIKPLIFNKKVNKIDLATTLPIGLKLTAICWENPIKKNGILHYVTLEEPLKKTLSKPADVFSIIVKQPPNSTPKCIGDDGGPVISGGKLCGITSLTDRFCTAATTEQFTNLLEYVSWICMGTENEVCPNDK